ncbi:MAG: Wzt carbohydrate-binding domain-containing protein [Dissulfurispiraceae bacterium]
MKRRYFFDHIAKTGGVSIDEIVTGILGKEAASPRRLITSHRDAIRSYSKYDFISGHTVFMPNEQLDESRYYFTMLRDPLDRLISQYWYQRVNMKDRNHVHLYPKELSFEEYVSSNAVEVVNLISNIQVKHFAQLAWDGIQILTDDLLLASAKTALERFDLVGVFHRYGDFVDVLCFECGWPPVDRIPRSNVTARRKSVAELDATTRNRLEELNKLDIDLYCFATALFEKRMRATLRKAINIRSDCLSQEVKLPERASTKADRCSDTESALAGVESAASFFAEYGDRKIEITSILINGEISLGSQLVIGENTHVTIGFSAHYDETNVTLGIQIFDETGQFLFGTNSRCYGKDISVFSGGRYFAEFVFRNDLGMGSYIVGAHIHRGMSPMEGCFHWKDVAANFEVISDSGFHSQGRYKLYPSLEMWTSDSPEMLVIGNDAEQLRAVQRICTHTPCIAEFSGRIVPVKKIDVLYINEIIMIEVEVTNISHEMWQAGGLRPVCLSYHWQNAYGGALIFDGLRTKLPRSLAPGESVRHFMVVKAPEVVGKALLQLTLIQEHVAWFDIAGCPSCDMVVDIRSR